MNHMTFITRVVTLIYKQNPLETMLTRSIQNSETSINFVQGPPGSRREQVKSVASKCLVFGYKIF